MKPVAVIFMPLVLWIIASSSSMDAPKMNLKRFNDNVSATFFKDLIDSFGLHQLTIIVHNLKGNKSMGIFLLFCISRFN